MNPEELALAIIKAAVDAVGISTVVRLVTGHAGGPEQIAAILAAEYAATDAALDAVEKEKLK